jgi:hypothetical protein
MAPHQLSKDFIVPPFLTLCAYMETKKQLLSSSILKSTHFGVLSVNNYEDFTNVMIF